MLTTLIGANVNGKPNYITIAHVGIMTLQSISLGMGKSHYTNAGIKENGTFSASIFRPLKWSSKRITAG